MNPNQIIGTVHIIVKIKWRKTPNLYEYILESEEVGTRKTDDVQE